MHSGLCFSCPNQYILFGGICWSVILQNPQCSSFSGITCLNCYAGYYLYDGICVLGSSLCATLDVNTGACLSCISGYTLSGSNCIKSSGCASVSNTTGQCVTCPTGYVLWFGLCVDNKSNNPYCLTFTGSNCLVCQNGYFINNQGICVGLISVCLTYDMSSGSCLTCPAGYSIIGTICWSVISVNPNCATFNGLICTACFPGYYFNNGICIMANIYCKTYDQNTGFCLTCITGYYKSGNLCYYNGACLSSNSTNGFCLSCGPGFVLSSNHCVEINDFNPYCKSFAIGTTTCT
jgi:hypothetical protein